MRLMRQDNQRAGLTLMECGVMYSHTGRLRQHQEDAPAPQPPNVRG